MAEKRSNTNYDVLDKILQDNDTARGRWVKTSGGGEEWIPEGEMSAADWYQEQKRIDEIERYLRS